MSGLFFDVWDASDPNGTALGELTAAYNKTYRHVHQAIGVGEFTINRHDAQAAWAATDNLVRVRRVAGGPFAYDSANYVGAFWIEGGDDTLLSPEEEGGEELHRSGRTAEACLRWARLYHTAFDPLNDRFVTKTTIDGNWHIDDRTAGEVLAIFLRDLDDRTPDPLPFVSKDFGVHRDSLDVEWSDTGTDWRFPVGTSGLELLETCVSGDLFYRVSPAFVFSAYEDEPGTDLSASITFAKGVNIEQAAERQVHARETVGRVLVQGTKESGRLKFREVVNTTVEASLPGRREGFVEFKRTPTNAKLDRAGNRYIRKSKLRHDGIPSFVVTEADGQEAMLDYVPGDIVTVTVDTELTGAKRIYSVTLTEDEAGNVVPTLEFEASPFDPATNQEGAFDEGGNGGGGGNPTCADCPPIPPHVPVEYEPGDCTDGTGTYSPQAAGSYGPLNSETSDAAGFVQYGRPGAAPLNVPDPNHAGDWNFEELGVGGSPDFAGDCAGNELRVFAVGPGTITIATAVYGAARTLSWAVQHFDGTAPVNDSTGTVALGATITATIPDDGYCVHWVSVTDSGTPCGSKWGFAGYTWAPVVASDPPLEGQQHAEQLTGDGTTVEFQTNYPYAPNSLQVWVDGVLWTATETDPETGTFTLDEAPANGAVIVVRYQNAGTTSTGADNPEPSPSSPSPGVTDHGALTGLADDDHPQYLKEKASGGLASEVPEHSHAGSSTGGALDSSYATDAEVTSAIATHAATPHALTSAELVAMGVVGPLLIADDHSTPIVFGDLLLTEEGNDFLYADIGG